MRIDDLDRGRVRPGVAEQQLADLAALGPGLGRAGRAPVRALASATPTRSTGWTPTARCTPASARAPRSARPRRRRTARCPEGAYPGTCRELTRAAARRARGGGAPAGAAPARRRGDRRVHRPPARAPARASSTIWSYAATTASRHTISPWSSTTQLRGSARSCAAPTSSRRRRASCTSPPGSGSPAPSYAHVPLVLGADGARLAKRHGAVTLADRVAAGAVARRRCAPSSPARSGSRAAGELPTLDELLHRFDPSALPTEPTVLTTWT